MMLAALVVLVLGSPEGLRYERLFEGLRYERPADLVLRGTVFDQSGLPVPRALVYIEGTQTKPIDISAID